MGRTCAFLDMDPGIDDALALITAVNRLSVQGVTTVAGNVGVDQTFQNAHRILHVAGHEEIPVIPGTDSPLCYPLMKAEDIHGFSGMDGFPWEFASVPIPPERAWDWLPPRIAAQTEPCHFIATGPLTNLALLFWTHPEAMRRFASITCMAGALPGTKVDKAAEFNVFVDPHAADVVFRMGHRLRLIGINVTHRALVPIHSLTRLSRFGRVGEMLKALLTYYARHARGEGGNPDAIPIDDAVAVAAVDAPELFQWTEMPITVVREGPLRGTLIMAPFGSERPDIQIATEIDVPGFLEWLWASLGEEL